VKEKSIYIFFTLIPSFTASRTGLCGKEMNKNDHVAHDEGSWKQIRKMPPMAREA
jgi:hypothetical protein